MISRCVRSGRSTVYRDSSDLASPSSSQRKCFDTPLQLQEIDTLFRMIAEHDPAMVTDGGMTAEGMLYFHTRFIHQGRVGTSLSELDHSLFSR